jgi:sugar O-acyltransferase (sialic acid O-acetyltransferase NeuD family)
MIRIPIPTTDVNSESVSVVRWYVEDGATVAAGEALVEIETSKAILDVESPAAGVLLRACAEGDQVKLDAPLGHLFESVDALQQFEREQASVAVTLDAGDGRITVPARRRAAELGLDIDEIARGTDELVSTKVVEAFAARNGNGALPRLLDPLDAPPGVRRLVIIGAGLGATQVIDILQHNEEQQAVAVVDDNRERFGDIVEGVPVVGGVDRALRLFSDGAIDAAVIAISTSVPARTRLRRRCEEAGLPLANVIDPTARIATGVRLGAGNVVCAHCHFGVGTVVGDNNFLSAYNSFDHHSELGSDISTGPGCMTSGLVHIGDRCRLGTGIFIEPHVTLGEGVQVASGAIIVASVPAEHAVKARVVTTAVVALKRS